MDCNAKYEWQNSPLRIAMWAAHVIDTDNHTATVYSVNFPDFNAKLFSNSK